MLNQNLFGRPFWPGWHCTMLQYHHLPAKDGEGDLRQSADLNKGGNLTCKTTLEETFSLSFPPQENTSLCEIGLSTKMFTCHKTFNFRINSKMLRGFAGQAFPY